MKERRVRIMQHSDPCNPRTEWNGHVGRMICFHRNYDLGDKHSYDADDCMKALACEASPDIEEKIDRLEDTIHSKLADRALRFGHASFEDRYSYADSWVSPRVNALIESALSDGYVILPLYLYDHSGISMSVGRDYPFNCPWDSGQVGVIVCDKKTIDEEFGGDKDKAEKALRDEVEVYDQYIRGDVYGFIIEERETEDCEHCEREFDWEHVDSCFGFYGHGIYENGMTDHLSDEDADLAAAAEIEYPNY